MSREHNAELVSFLEHHKKCVESIEANIRKMDAIIARTKEYLEMMEPKEQPKKCED